MLNNSDQITLLKKYPKLIEGGGIVVKYHNKIKSIIGHPIKRAFWYTNGYGTENMEDGFPRLIMIFENHNIVFDFNEDEDSIYAYSNKFIDYNYLNLPISNDFKSIVDAFIPNIITGQIIKEINVYKVKYKLLLNANKRNESLLEFVFEHEKIYLRYEFGKGLYLLNSDNFLSEFEDQHQFKLVMSIS